jgi:hypothetical protein
LAVAVLQSVVPTPPPGAEITVWSVAGTPVITRAAAGTMVFGLLPVVPMTLISAALMWVVSALTPSAHPRADTIARYFPGRATPVVPQFVH